MDTLKIRALLLAIKYKSLSKAAQEFCYTPSALSHSVDSLESELGVKLLNRSPKGVELTDQGKELICKLSAVVEAEDELRKSASVISDSKNNSLRIGTYSSISVNLLPEILKGFKKQYPEISISITVGNRIGSWLEEDVSDVLFGIEYPQYNWLPIVKDDFVAVVPHHLFEGCDSISCSRLYSFPFIITGNSDVERILNLNKFKEIIELSSDDDMAAVSMVRAGMGITILPSLVVKDCPKGIRIIKLEQSLYRSLGISYNKMSPHCASMKFVEYLKKE